MIASKRWGERHYNLRKHFALLVDLRTSDANTCKLIQSLFCNCQQVKMPWKRKVFVEANRCLVSAARLWKLTSSDQAPDKVASWDGFQPGYKWSIVVNWSCQKRQILRLYYLLNREKGSARLLPLNSSHLGSTKILFTATLSIISRNRWFRKPCNLFDWSVLKAVLLSM